MYGGLLSLCCTLMSVSSGQYVMMCVRLWVAVCAGCE